MITLESFQSQLNPLEIDAVMQSACQTALSSPVGLYSFMHRFVHYARAYSALVPSLCSSIGSSPFFKDPHCAFQAHAERSMDVAAKVFTASIEEFCDPRTGVSHRTLSYALLDKLADYASLTTEDVNTIASSGDWLIEIISVVEDNYTAQASNLASLIRAMGFHAAAETIGENECSIIDAVLFKSQRAQAFGEFIRRSKVSFTEGTVSPWYWIVIHGTEGTKGLEVEHSADALEALNRAVAYTSESEDQIIAWASEGFGQFAEVQKAFFTKVRQEIQAIPNLAAVA